MKIFKQKKVEISNFEPQKCYISQKKAENLYYKDSARKSKISSKNFTTQQALMQKKGT